MITPTIHLNGTSGRDLLEQVCAASRALDKAADAMIEAGPNARDYYPQPEGAWAQARDEHRSRLDRLRAILEEYEAMALAISGQVDAQDARKRR